MRFLTLVLITHFSLLATTALSKTNDSNSPAVVLPSELCKGLFVVSMTVESGGNETTIDLLLDTGSSWTFVTPAAARRILGPEMTTRRVLFKSARVGQYEFGPLRAHVLALDTISLALGRKIDGILGFPAFKDVLLTLDYPAKQVSISSGRLQRPDGREIFGFTGFKRPHLKIDVGGHRVKVLLDSGATGHFLLKTQDRLNWSVEPRPAKTVAEVTGTSVVKGGRLAQIIKFGPLQFDAPIVFVSKSERLVGWRVLRHFKLTFDQRTKRIRIAPENKAPVQMPPVVGTGLGIRALSDGSEVVEVFSGTSAAASGMRKGDLIVAVNGVPVHERGCADPRGAPVGKRDVLTFDRNGVRAETEIENEILIP